MLSLKPSLVIQPPIVSPSYVQGTRLESKPTSSHAHTSFFRSFHLDMQIYSPSVQVVKHSGLAILQSCPVFGDQDKIQGKVMLDSSCSQNGRLTITLDGTFEYLSVKDSADDDGPRKPIVRKYRHVFLSSSATIPILPIPESRSTIRGALSVRKRPSASSLNSPACRSCEFSFEPPRGSRTGVELPSTFSFKTSRANPRRQPRLEEIEVAYRITAVWEPSDESGKQAILEAPLMFQPDTDFQSVDGSDVVPESWLEIPLFPERPIPFNCAVTLPCPQSFSRCSSIPYFVVFMTNPRSPSLIKEIAADATIVVSLIRKITITPQRTPPPPPTPALPDTPPASDDSDHQASPLTPRYGLLKRTIKRPTRSHSRDHLLLQTKPQLERPEEVFSVTRTLQTEVFIGFPKRARANRDGASHVLPDGLYKGKVQLSKDMLPSMDWPGISVKYYLDVSVLFGQDDVRAHIPIKIC
ncbi:hypothetical protein JVU11DRAFT_5866 [Chiua virens]|nr:hypothetical protein JVU11DRAFT_5866 [Chiua virens]